MKSCKQCKKLLDADARFCSACGVEQEVELLKDVEDSLSKGITVEFPLSKYASFECALAEAKKLSTFQELGEGKARIYRVSCELDSIEDLLPLVGQMKGWNSRTVYLEGEKVVWGSVFSFSECFERKKSSYKPEFYCLGYERSYFQNIWGCINTGLAFHEHAEWFAWGHWLNKKGDWEFDKKKIRRELEKSLFPYRFCPALKLDFVEKVLSAFPDVINTRTDKNWEIVTRWNVGIYKDAPGVKYARPKGPGAMNAIIRKIGRNLPKGEFDIQLLNAPYS